MRSFLSVIAPPPTSHIHTITNHTHCWCSALLLLLSRYYQQFYWKAERRMSDKFIYLIFIQHTAAYFHTKGLKNARKEKGCHWLNRLAACFFDHTHTLSLYMIYINKIDIKFSELSILDWDSFLVLLWPYFKVHCLHLPYTLILNM